MSSFESQVLGHLETIADSLVGAGVIPIDLQSCLRNDTGAPLAVFADGASAVPGTAIVNSEQYGVRWNNHATPTPISRNVHLPIDIDTAYPIVFHGIGGKTGATVGDVTTLTVEAFITKLAQLTNADADAGGASSAVDPDITAQTLQDLTYTITAANLTAALGTGGPGMLSITFGPTDGTLGTDDFFLVDAYLTYTRRAV
jgi:hypothetical protein